MEQYESLPTTSVVTNMTAGAIAGVLEHCVMYPLDSVKTRMQSMSPTTANYDIMGTLSNMIKKEGLMRPIRGVTAVVAGAGPAHALYFGSYEMTKELLTNVTKNNNINYMVSGAAATVIHDAVSNPTDVIKQRMQMYNSPYKSVIKCMTDVYRKEGIQAFYRSYVTQLVMNIPYQSIHFATYEFFQNMLNHERKYYPTVHVIAGGAAGACAAALTTPLDVVKTLLNTQEAGFTEGMMQAIRQIYSMAGPSGFFKGLGARVLYSMPATAICWSTYEFFKFYLTGKTADEYKSSITGKNILEPRKTLEDVNQGQPLYVIPNTPTTTDSMSETNSVTTFPSKDTSSGINSIKTVCDISTNVMSPTINMHTRHSEVKSPFDRGLSSP